jgi:uncharacterized Fe-S cluster protein YjdI
MINKEDFNGLLCFFDIETALMEVYTHYIGSKVSVYHNQIKQDKRVICISYKEAGWENPKHLTWDNGDDTKMLKKFREIASKYPVLIGQNGDEFDIKVLNGMMWARGLPPFKNIHSLDTLKMSRYNMKLVSHKLDYKLQVIRGAGNGKVKMEMQDWIDVQNGNKVALKKMVEYCDEDVNGLEDVFWSLLPYVNKLPFNLGVLLHGDRDSCPQCGSKEFKKNGTRPSNVGLKQRWICHGCGNDWTDSRLKSTTDKK